MKKHHSGCKGRSNSRTTVKQGRSGQSYHLRIELLEERCLLAGPPPVSPLLLPAVAGVYPNRRAMFDAEYQASLAGIPNNKPTADGIAWGKPVANAVLAWRSGDDLRTTIPTYVPAPPGGTPGVYELTPQAGLEAKGTLPLPALTPQRGQVTPCALASPPQFLPPTPPPRRRTRTPAP